VPLRDRARDLVELAEARKLLAGRPDRVAPPPPDAFVLLRPGAARSGRSAAGVPLPPE
jgi:hypothetical protein